MQRRNSLQIAIDARVNAGQSGGVGQAIANLIHDLGKLDDGTETYKIVVKSEDQKEWLKPFLAANQEVVFRRSSIQPRSQNLLKRPLNRLVRYLIKISNENRPQPPEMAISDGFYEALGCNVIHFMNQLDFVLCAIPTIYNPHDLQHLHYPQFFTPTVLAQRETIYRAACHFSHTVVVGSEWIKDDLIRLYRMHPDKVQVIPEGPPVHSKLEADEQHITVVKYKYSLEQPFILYPAVTWQHKNHIRLLEALAYLRDQHDLMVQLVCTGSLYSFWPQIENRIKELNLQSQVKFLGYVPDKDLQAIYRLSEFLVMPTLFEASSLPIFEAWFEGVAVACANITALPDQVLDAALLFAPLAVRSIAQAILELMKNVELRQTLITRGYQRIQDFDGERTAKAYRAVYRRAAGHSLNEEERWILSWDWMRNP